MRHSLKALTKAENVVISVFMCACVLSACTKDDEPEKAVPDTIIEVDVNDEPIQEHVTINFAPIYKTEPMTRSNLSSSGITHLDVWIFEGSTEISAVHQTSTDVGFGSVSLSLNKTKTYTLYAVGHKSDGQVTLADGVISFPEDKVKDTFWYTTTFSPSTTTAINAEMSRIVSMFRMETTDPVPSDVKKINITQGSVYDRWNVSTGATHQLDRISSIAITSTASDGTVALSVYAINTDAQTLHTITVDALDADDNTVQTRTFNDVPLRNGYKTIYRGAFFTDQSMSMSFTADEWNEYDTISF